VQNNTKQKHRNTRITSEWFERGTEAKRTGTRGTRAEEQECKMNKQKPQE
jgi:hypothetical protein